MVKDDHNDGLNREQVLAGDAPEEYLEYLQAVDGRDNAHHEPEGLSDSRSLD